MRKALYIILLATIALTAWESYSLWPAKPCAKPIAYALGSFDNRFGISQEAFLEDLKEAEAIWEEPMGRDLFTYASTTRAMRVNLVYDYRQKATKDLASIDNTLKQGNAQYREMDRVYQARKSSYDKAKAAYDAEAEAWQAARAAYEAEAERWNAGPRNSKAEFDALESSRLALESQGAALKEREGELNALAKEVNLLVAQLNALAKDLNLGVRQYNQVGQERGETFTGGLYTADEDGERIDIFEFETKPELVHLLAHELGHALGLEHIQDPSAIMYYIATDPGTAASAADLAALKAVCGIREPGVQ